MNIHHTTTSPDSSPIRFLLCACCGASTTGRQWHNRDTGYGVCAECVDRIISRHRMTADEITSCYGVRGTHYDLPTDTDPQYTR